MDGYLLGIKELKCQVVTDNRSRRFKGSGRKFKFIPWKIIAKNRINQKKTDKQNRKTVRKLL